EAKNPGIRISYLGLPTDQYMQKINTAIATRSTPDLLTPKASDIAALVAQKALAPLDDRLRAAGLEQQISPQMLKSSRAAAPDGTCTLDDPAVISACEAYVALFGKQTARSDLTADFKAMVAQFGKGGAGMLSHSIGSYPNHVAALGADKVGVVAPFPATGHRV